MSRTWLSPHAKLYRFGDGDECGIRWPRKVVHILVICQGLHVLGRELRKG